MPSHGYITCWGAQMQQNIPHTKRNVSVLFNAGLLFRLERGKVAPCLRIDVYTHQINVSLRENYDDILRRNTTKKKTKTTKKKEKQKQNVS